MYSHAVKFMKCWMLFVTTNVTNISESKDGKNSYRTDMKTNGIFK